MGGGGSQGRGDREWRASAQEPERADWIEGIWIATLNVDGLMRQGPHRSTSSYACLLRLLNVFFVVISADIITLLRSIRSTSSWVRVGEGELLKFIYIPRESRSPKGIPTAPTGPAFYFLRDVTRRCTCKGELGYAWEPGAVRRIFRRRGREWSGGWGAVGGETPPGYSPPHATYHPPLEH